MHAFLFSLVLISLFFARPAEAGSSLLQILHSGEFQRITHVASETTNDDINEEESEVDGDYLEVDIRRHHGQPKKFIDSRIRRGVLSGNSLVVPFADHSQSENSSIAEASQRVVSDSDGEHAPSHMVRSPGHIDTQIPEHPSAEQLAAARQIIATSGMSLAHSGDDAAVASLALSSSHPANPGVIAHGLELMIGVVLGVLLSLLALTAMGYWSPKPAARNSSLPGQAPMPNPGLSRGNLDVVQFNYHGSSFMQFSWTFDGGSHSIEHDPVPILSDNKEVARALGRLMATPNGEMYLTSAGSTWAILKRPLPNRRPGQLWDFKVCQADGTPYAEVKQRSETKFHVDDAVFQRRIMTVIGNFTYPVFLSGERSIHIWLTPKSARPSLCAQCEARPEMEAEELPPSSQSRRFHVTTTSNVDASLVMAILLGIQDVHKAATRPPNVPQTSGSERSVHSTESFQVGAASSYARPAAGTSVPKAAPSGNTAASSSSGNGVQDSGSSAQPSVSPTEAATEPAMAA